jgi:molybdopterin-guanine dinucleotide biosynthesis protein MobB
VKAFHVVGASRLGRPGFVPDLIAALRIEGLTVSAIKRAPDGFDLDRPGKVSHARREAGCREVMLVGDRRLVLMHEYGTPGEPALDALLGRLAAVDVVVVEGFRTARLPTVEVCVPAQHGAMRGPTDPRVFAVVSDEPLASRLPVFAAGDAAGLAGCVVDALGLRR